MKENKTKGKTPKAAALVNTSLTQPDAQAADSWKSAKSLADGSILWTGKGGETDHIGIPRRKPARLPLSVSAMPNEAAWRKYFAVVRQSERP